MLNTVWDGAGVTRQVPLGAGFLTGVCPVVTSGHRQPGEHLPCVAGGYTDGSSFLVFLHVKPPSVKIAANLGLSENVMKATQSCSVTESSP